MNSSQDILIDLQRKGFKLTKTRTKIITLLQENQPLSVPEILTELKNIGLTVNKTTVYREIDFLLSQQLIKEVNFRERGKKYEFDGKTHHHHLFCLNCKGVQDFELLQDLDKVEEKISQSKNFKVLSHSLEFFGFCKICQPNN